ncbi:MAG TPA: BrnT family toxin [Smithella sp.]|nr:BrnT family toxin [Smithella sp.]HQG64127.1 BrnT family toxin [Smithella sp.]HQH17877.1 BrnT family toxin [Smithella sp.]HQI71518.1 BrnT family toxin [Smithella sp.]
MQELRFEWDEKKYKLNQKKHGISFLEAQTVFSDENGLLLDDPDHSLEEERYVILGMSSKLRLLVISHTYRREDLIVRIISARKATRMEQKQYWSRW